MTIDVSQRNRARLKHLLSYLLVSTLPILLCGLLLISYTYGRRTEQADAAALNGLTLFSKTYSALLGAMDACAGHLADNLTMYDAEGYESLPRQLSSYQKNYTLFTGVFYYQKGDEGIYTSNGRINYYLFEQQFGKEYGVDLNMTALFTNVNGTTSNMALRSRALSSNFVDGEYIFYLRTVPALDARPRGVMVFLVSTDTLRQLLDECVPPSYAFYMYSDQYLTWLFRSDSGGEGGAGALLQERLNRLLSTALSLERVGGRDYLLMRAKSETDNMQHMMAYECGLLYANFRAERARSAGLLLLLLLPVAAVAYLLHRHMYSPIDTILDLPLPQGTQDGSAGAGADALLGGVARRARAMIDQNELLREQLKDQRALLRTQLAMHLISGGAQADIDLVMASFGPEERPFPYPLYTVAYAEAAQVPAGGMHGEAREIVAHDLCAYVVPLRASGQFAVLLNHAETERARLGSAALEALAKLGVPPTRAGLSLTQRQKGRLPISLMQAQAVACASNEAVPIAYFADDVERASLTCFLPFSRRMLLCQCVRNGRKEIALATLHQMRADMLLLSGNETVMRCCCFFLFDAVTEVAREHHMEDLLEEMPVDELLYLAQEECFARLEHIVGLACERICSQETRMLEEKQAQMLRYVDERSREQSMSLSRLSEAFQLSESYITRFFKQHTGMSFLQYVSQRRLDYVRDQLVATERPIKDIVCDAGYADIANFTRKFRQIEGVTPGAYRQRHSM